MKKKYLLLILVVFILIVCLTACQDNGEVLHNINLMQREDYSKIFVDVSTNNGDTELTGSYSFIADGDKVNVSYDFYQLASFDVSGSVVTAPEQFKTRVVGTAVISGDTVTHINGDEIAPEILSEFDASRLNFRLSLFDNIKITNNTFSADVVNAKDFFGDDSFDGVNVKVLVGFRKSLDKIELSYEQNGAEVLITYKFVV